MNIKIAGLVFYFCFYSAGISQEIEDSYNFSQQILKENRIDFQKDLSSFYNDGVSVFKAAGNFSSTEYFLTGTLIAVAGAAYFSDARINTSITNNKSSLMNNVSSVGEKYGNSLYAGILGSGLYLTGTLLNNNGISSSGRMVVESVIYTGLAVSILKYTIGRARPYQNEGHADFFDYTFTEENVSFPSGHTATAFAVSTVLSGKIDNTFVSVGLYGLAGLTAYQRMYDNKHWFSDVIVGAAIGYFIGSVISREDEKRKNTFFNNIDIIPSLNSSGAGLSFHYDF
jgi:membrane-associated phospholipid phosphatase